MEFEKMLKIFEALGVNFEKFAEGFVFAANTMVEAERLRLENKLKELPELEYKDV